MRKAALFLAITFGLSWGLAGIYYALGGRLTSPYAIIMLLLYMYTPALSAIIVQKAIYKEPVMGPLKVSFRWNRWFLVAWLLPLVIALAAMRVSLLFPGVEFSWGMEGLYERLATSFPPDQIAQMKEQAALLPVHPFWLAMIQGLIAGITVNAFFGFGEELGWRGLLQDQLSFLGFWRSSLLIGLIWGVWHTPVIIQGYNYPASPLIGAFLMITWTLLLSPLFSYVRLRSGSVVAAAIVHGSLNGTIGLSFMLLKGGNELIVGGMGLAGFIVLFAANLGLWFYDRTYEKEPVA